MTPEQVIAAYDALVLKGIAILDYYASEHEHPKLCVEGGVAWLSCAKSYTEYDNCCLESDESESFPVGLLAAPPAEIKAWQRERKKLQEEESRQWYAKNALERENQERSQLAKLKDKYEK